MTIDEISKSLCYYDKRNPDCSVDDQGIEEHRINLLRLSKKLGYDKQCSCDNCFYSRTELADALLDIHIHIQTVQNAKNEDLSL